MHPAALIALGGVGLGVGFLSGLVGIGGGVLIVPFLYFFYGHPTWTGTTISTELLVTVAHATSLFIIVPTAVTGTVTFSRARLVAWQAAVPIALFSVAAAAMGATLAVEMPAEALSFGFGLFLTFTGIQIAGTKPRTEVRPMRLQLWITALTGTLIGLLSATLGVGGGLVAIPMLLYVVRLDVARVAATSLAVVGLAAMSGSITYIVTGYGLPGRPPGSLGFVHVTAALPILVGSIFAVRWGAKANQKVNRKVLRWLFGAAFILMGLRLAWQSGVRLFG
jgi:hypothetical protein